MAAHGNSSEPEKTSQQLVSMPRWYLLVVLIVSLVALVLSGVAYTNLAIARSDRINRENIERAKQTGIENDKRWCTMLTRLDDNARQVPPTTASGKLVAQDIHDLRIRLGCPDGPR